MKKIRSLLCLLIIFCVVPLISVDAEECSADEIKILKEKADAIQIDTEFDDELASTGIFSEYIVSIYGLSDDIYIMTSDFSKGFFYEDMKDGVISDNINDSVTQLNVYSKKCYDVILRKIKLEFKKYNIFSNSSVCLEIGSDKLNVCSKFLDENITEKEFLAQVEKYQNSFLKSGDDKTFLDYIKEHYYLVVGGMLLLILFVIFIIIKRRKRNILD